MSRLLHLELCEGSRPTPPRQGLALLPEGNKSIRVVVVIFNQNFALRNTYGHQNKAVSQARPWQGQSGREDAPGTESFPSSSPQPRTGTVRCPAGWEGGAGLAWAPLAPRCSCQLQRGTFY